jgi:hypothetical protein
VPIKNLSFIESDPITCLWQSRFIVDVWISSDIIFGVEIFHGFLPYFQTLLKTTKGKPLVFFFKSVWAAKQPQGAKGYPF